MVKVLEDTSLPVEIPVMECLLLCLKQSDRAVQVVPHDYTREEHCKEPKCFEK